MQSPFLTIIFLGSCFLNILSRMIPIRVSAVRTHQQASCTADENKFLVECSADDSFYQKLPIMEGDSMDDNKKNIMNEIPQVLPVIPTMDVVIFPHMVVPLLVID